MYYVCSILQSIFLKQNFTSRTAVRDILTIPSVVSIKGTDQIDCRVYSSISSLRASSPIWANLRSGVFFFFFFKGGRGERHKGMIGRVHDLRLYLGKRSKPRENVRARGLLSAAPRVFAARSRVLARLVSLAQIGELACRLTYQPISARGSDPDPVVCMKVRFKAKLIGGFLSLLAANRSQSRG